MKPTFLLLALFISMLVGCASQPTPEQIAAADYGQEPANYQKIIEQFLHKSLFDPYSAVYENWRGPEQSYVSNAGGYLFGYRVCVDINSKNRFGAYVGLKPCYFLIKNDEVVTYLCSTDNQFLNEQIEKHCRFF